ncbi:HAMP domain-containing histidine kinase [Aerophototrophica crusticola]|uniref:histidine kinase n=1 Tax=Aerophototrophica crusticola TaxID=1709002 RepID=A0A858R8T0_9PROT|nr:HAMP domain-containing histidine kinase [Rhodospirillaceae bacterium B3]
MRNLLRNLIGAAPAETLAETEAALEAARRQGDADRQALQAARAEAASLRAALAAAEAKARDLPPPPATPDPAGQQTFRLLAAASHDLRQPFQAMRLFLHLLEGRLSAPKDLELAQRLEEALEAGAGQVNALLDLATLEAGTAKVSLGAVPLGPLLSRLVEEFTPQAAAKGITLRLVATRAAVRSDPVLLEKMLRPLLDNAIRFGTGDKVLVGARRRGAVVEAQVLDQGPGIPAERQDAVFQPFIRGDDRGKDRKGGLGLGLAIVRRTGDLLGHATGVRTVPGRGACFFVGLALDGVVPAAGPEPAAPSPRPGMPACWWPWRRMTGCNWPPWNPWWGAGAAMRPWAAARRSCWRVWATGRRAWW